MVLGVGAETFMGLATSSDLIHWTKKAYKAMSSAVVGFSVSASTAILIEGSNKKDKIVNQWIHDSTASLLRQSTVALPIIGTKLSAFAKEGSTYGDTTAGATPGAHAANYIYFNRVTGGVGAEFLATGIQIYFNALSKPTTGKVRLALYTNQGTYTPKNLIAATDEKNWVDVIGGLS